MNNNPMQLLSQMISRGMNPQQIMQQMVMSNPQGNFFLNQVKQSGLSMKDYTLQFAKQRNIDINPIIQMMSQFGIKL